MKHATQERAHTVPSVEDDEGDDRRFRYLVLDDEEHDVCEDAENDEADHDW